MKNAKLLGLLPVMAAALMAFAGSASATITSPTGTVYNGVIHGATTNMTLHTGVKISCKQQAFEGQVTNGGTTIPLTAFTFGECGSDTIVTLAKGHLTLASDGTVTSTGLEVTKLSHRTVFGFPVTQHCLLDTSNTKLGTLTEGVNPPVLHFSSASIPHLATDGACGETTIYTGTYTVTKPTSAIVVD